MPSFGAGPGAPVTLVVFGDFECPVCQKEEQELRKNLPASPLADKVRVYFTDFPLTLAYGRKIDALRLRYRKHRDLIDPFSVKFQPKELLHELDFVVFNLLTAIVFPFYLVWLFVTYGELAPIILLGVQVALLALLPQLAPAPTHPLPVLPPSNAVP